MHWEKRLILAALVLLTATLPISGSRPDKSIVSAKVSGGLSLDITPSGIERKFLGFQGTLTTSSAVSPALKFHVLIHPEQQILRIPVLINLNFPTASDSLRALTFFGGAGIELSRVESGPAPLRPYLTAGAELHFGPFFMEIPVDILLRENDSDTYVSLLFGYAFNHFR